MKYLVSKFPCTLIGKSSVHLDENVKYELKNIDDNICMLFGDNGELPSCINFKTFEHFCSYHNILQFDFRSDNYIILYPQIVLPTTVNVLKIQNKELIISLSNELSISIDGENILKESVSELTYSHYEMRAEYCIIYFIGKRNFVVIIKEKELCCADYYDEINITDSEIYFMTRLYDSLNHGRVYSIKDKKFDSYLIYLDEYDMNLKSDFSMSVFLDALIAKNFNYCNAMLDEDIHQSEAKSILEFFPKFDDYYPLDSTNVALIEKNTLAGIFEFHIKDNKIENIIAIS